MTSQPIEQETVETSRVACDGGKGGHPRVWLQIPEDTGWTDCPYCEKRYILAEGANAH